MRIVELDVKQGLDLAHHQQKVVVVELQESSTAAAPVFRERGVPVELSLEDSHGMC